MGAPRSPAVSTVAVVILVLVVLVVVGIAYYIAAPLGAGGTTTQSTQIVQVRIPEGAWNSSLSFTPATVTVVIGVNNTIQWKNFDTVAHTITSTSVPKGAQPFGSASNLVGPGQLFTITLDVPGTYQYACAIHPHMTGTIIVKEG
jgi:plastocyanin